MDDGIRLHIERFGVSSAESTRVVVFLHGIGAHAGPFRGLATELLSSVDAVYLPHMRGHGLSDGERAALGGPSRVLSDIEAVLQHVRAQHPGAEVVLGGESMGGLFALAYTASRHSAPDRLLLLAPALKLRGVSSVHPSQWFPLAWRTLRHGFPLDTTAHDEVARHETFRQKCRTDPAMLSRAPLGYLITIGRFQRRWSARYPGRVTVPVMVIQGTGDRLLDPTAAERLSDLLPEAVFHRVEGGWHNLLWDPTTPDTIASIKAWLERREVG